MNRTKLFLFSVASFAGVFQGCDCGSDNAGPGDKPVIVDEGKCGYDCKQTCTPGLPQGLIGGYTSIVTAPDGVIHVAGYNDFAFTPDVNVKYGDLVYGTFNREKGEVEWQTVDGVPTRDTGTAGCPIADRDGWRKGEDEPGDNVGLHTSIQLDPRGRPMIAYYDNTKKSLRFARIDGGFASYSITEVKQGFNRGRYAKQLIVGGRPVVIYSGFEPDKDGKRISKVSIAKSASDFPSKATDWTFEDIYSSEALPCVVDSCSDGTACVLNTGKCSATVSTCSPTCNVDFACIKTGSSGSCVPTSPVVPTSYPKDVGDDLQVAQSGAGIAIVSYDRVHGDLLGFSNADGSWKRIVLDSSMPDVGVSPSIAVDGKGDWHVTYINNSSGALQYVRVVGGKTAGKPEIIDNGLGLAGTLFPDGIHKVGDDSEVRVAGDGTVELLYQDATVGTLRYAKGVVSGTTHTWTVAVASQPGRFAGFFPHWVPGGNDIVNFWRVTDTATKSIFGNVALLTRP